MRRRLIFIAFTKGHKPVFLLYAYLFFNLSNLESQHPGFNLIALSLPIMSGHAEECLWCGAVFPSARRTCNGEAFLIAIQHAKASAFAERTDGPVGRACDTQVLFGFFKRFYLTWGEWFKIFLQENSPSHILSLWQKFYLDSPKICLWPWESLLFIWTQDKMFLSWGK